MAVRRPLCIVSGRQQELPAADELLLPVSYGDLCSVGTPTLEAWLLPGESRGAATTTTFSSGAVSRFAPFALQMGMTFDRIGIVVTQAASGSTIDVAIYDNDNFQPKNRLLSVTGLDGSTTGNKIATISLSLKPGLYWYGVYKSATSLQIRAAANNLYWGDNSLAVVNAYNSASGLTDPAPSLTTTTGCAQVFLRRSA